MKTMLALIGAAVMMISNVALADPGQGPSACTAAKLAGRYGFTVSGVILPGNPAGLPEGPAVATGFLILDANGNMHGYETISFNGNVTKGVPYSGTYQITPDCGFTLDSPGFFTNYGVMVANGNELLIMSTDYGMVITITAKRL